MAKPPLRPARTAQFKRDYERCKRRGYPIPELRGIMESLIAGRPLGERHRDHELSGEWIEGDSITFERTGTHADPFE